MVVDDKRRIYKNVMQICTWTLYDEISRYMANIGLVKGCDLIMKNMVNTTYKTVEIKLDQ